MVAGDEVAAVIHIHNGDVVRVAAERAAIPGEHMAYRESLVTGAIVPGDSWIETRARTLSDANGVDLLRVRTDLVEQEQALDGAARKGEIVLWFEHDLYCLVHLVYLLQRFAHARTSIVWSPQPLSDFDETQLHRMFESRTEASPAMRRLAREIWRAYASPDPLLLNGILDRDTAADFPFAREAVTLHLSRFPSTANGLGAIEQRILTHVAAGFNDFLSIFAHVNAEVPRFGFGDTEVFRHLRALAGRGVPLITLTGELPKAICTITPAGEKVLSGEADDVLLNPPGLWLGGAHLTKEQVWRFDGTRLSRWRS